jgi:hypothetical protein
MKYDWSRLDRLRVGRYAEYFVKMELTLHGIDIYTADVDDRGIDFVARTPKGSFYEVQVKSLRESGYIFFEKSKFELRANLVAAIVIFRQGEPPTPFLIPALEWLKPNSLLANRDYEGKKSAPEWGLNISKKNWPLLEQYGFEKMAGVMT